MDLLLLLRFDSRQVSDGHSFSSKASNRAPIPGFAGDGKLASPFRLEGGDVRCLQALGTLGDIEFNRLPLGE
jgi:hypothetical protein